MCIAATFEELCKATYYSNGDWELCDDEMHKHWDYSQRQGYSGEEFGMETEGKITVFFWYQMRALGGGYHERHAYRELAVLESSGVQIGYHYYREEN